MKWGQRVSYNERCDVSTCSCCCRFWQVCMPAYTGCTHDTDILYWQYFSSMGLLPYLSSILWGENEVNLMKWGHICVQLVFGKFVWLWWCNNEILDSNSVSCLFCIWMSRSAGRSAVGTVSVCRLHIRQPGVSSTRHGVRHQPLPPVPPKLCIPIHPQCQNMWVHVAIW